MIKHFIPTFAFLLLTATASAQFDFGRAEPDGGRHIGGPRLGESQNQIWRAGIVIEQGAALETAQITIPVPMEWKEQRILNVNEEKMDASLASQIVYRNLGGGAMEMVLQLANVRPTRRLEIVVAFELQNFALLPPENPGQYVIPARTRVPREFQQYLEKSPTIESDNPRFATMYREITKDRHTDWDKVEALYSFVQNNVKYDDQIANQPAKGALAVINMPRGEWMADCKDMSCLFVALCRAGGVPARIVRVPEHCYAEFYMEMKPEGQVRNAPPIGFWFPCQVAGTYSFGGIPERRVILQKGDAFPDYRNPSKKTLFLVESFQGTQPEGSPPPRPRWVHEAVAK
ncbi:MAG: transglutaminase-like domain-containing protein [Planctomycetaceae bacterium]|nr:transglutaminase-like domain-containing protein [Planctomycetaceae bacterium]